MRIFTRKRTSPISLLLLFLAGLLLAACGSNSPTASATTAASATATQCARPATSLRSATGTLKAITGATLSITNLQGNSVTVTYSSATRFIQETAVPLASLKEGTQVTVAGTNANNTYTASRITVVTGTSGFPRLNGTPGANRTRNNPCFNRRQFGAGANGGGSTTFRGIAGTVSQVSGNTLAITDISGANYSVAVTAQTQIVQSSVVKATALKVGQSLTIAGTAGSSGVISARSVTILLKLPAAATPAA